MIMGPAAPEKRKMNGERLIAVFSNGTPVSNSTADILRQKLIKNGFSVTDAVDTYDKNAELIICVGGDGSFLEAIQRFSFPSQPFVGINTGHMGFFQEIDPDEIDQFIDNYLLGRYEIQEYSTVKATIRFNDGRSSVTLRALNDIWLKAMDSHLLHLNLYIGGYFIEHFSGDGILVSTPAGSTAYNYSVGGAIVDPRLNLLQVAPISPSNTSAYRSFTSSVLLPADQKIKIVPNIYKRPIFFATDGREYVYENVEDVLIESSTNKVSLLRFDKYDFWAKVKNKFLE